MVTSMSAVLMNRRGYRSAVLDADITGPSIPQAFGLHEKAQGNETEIFPVTTETGIKVMSVNLLLPDETDPVIWRGPIIAGTAKQFWTDVAWGDVDYMFVDMPPGTGDVPLTVFQSIPLDGIIVVTSPQELVSMIVGKAVKMAEMMNVPIIGLVENMSYAVCPDCGKHMNVFGLSHMNQRRSLVLRFLQSSRSTPSLQEESITERSKASHAPRPSLLLTQRRISANERTRRQGI